MNLDTAEQLAFDGMWRALDHADRAHGGWSDLAYSFLMGFARTHTVFISEDVSDLTKEDASFPQPPTDRAWGAVYRRAIREGIIARHNSVGRSRRRHASICPVWQSRICEDPSHFGVA